MTSRRVRRGPRDASVCIIQIAECKTRVAVPFGRSAWLARRPNVAPLYFAVVAVTPRVDERRIVNQPLGIPLAIATCDKFARGIQFLTVDRCSDGSLARSTTARSSARAGNPSSRLDSLIDMQPTTGTGYGRSANRLLLSLGVTVVFPVLKNKSLGIALYSICI